MKYLMFEPQFESHILAGVKDTTIRPRKSGKPPRIKPGERFSLRVWTGRPYRSKQREFCQRAARFVFPVRISKLGIYRPDLNCYLVRHKVARAVGFLSWDQALAFYNSHHGLPFDGWLIHWEARP